MIMRKAAARVGSAVLSAGVMITGAFAQEQRDRPTAPRDLPPGSPHYTDTMADGLNAAILEDLVDEPAGESLGTVASAQSRVASAQGAFDFDDPDAVPWVFHFGLTSDGYNRRWQEYRSARFVPVDIETDAIGGARYAGVWQANEDGRRWVSYRNLTSEAFYERWNEYRARGYRPIDQDTVVLNGNVRYSLIMVENKENLRWISNRNLTSQQFSQRFNQYRGAYIPIDVDAVEINGNMRYSIIWVENRENRAWAEYRDMSPSVYGQRFRQFADQGYRVVDLDCYATNGNLRYAAIWEKNDPGRGWAARREMSVTWFNNYWKKYRDQGMRITDIEVCPASSGSGVRYAAVWRENDARFDWSGRATAEKELKDYVDGSDATSVGVAIVRNGRVIFRGGHGFADVDGRQWAHGGTIYRLASISKAVTGTLAYDMEEAGLIDLDDRTDSLLSDLGDDHVHSIRDLVRMEGCVSHYQSDGVDDNDTQTLYTTQQSALDNHMDGAITSDAFIVAGCSTGNYGYSTHSYTIAGAALEAVGNRSFDGLVRTRLAAPFGLDSLRMERRRSPAASGELAEVWGDTSRIDADDFENISWKAGGGGLQSSSVDLARFGDAVLRNRYFPAATRDAMWDSGAAEGRAGGWTRSGTRRFKGGAQQGSDTHIVIDTATGTTVVALTNRRSPSLDTRDLATTLLTLANNN